MAAMEGYELRPELNRKTFDTLNWLLSSVDRGNITEDQFLVAVDALFMALSGLVDNDFIHVITEAQGQCNKGKLQLKRLFHHADKDEIIRFSWTPGDSMVHTTMLTMGLATGVKSTEFDSPKDAFTMFNGAGRALEKRGWIEL